MRATSGGLLGALTLVGGLTWLLLYLPGTHRVTDATVGLVFAAGGLVLLMPHRLRLPGRVTSGVAAGLAAVGSMAGLLVSSAQLCCSFVYAMTRGFPFDWLQRAAVADDAATARRLTLGSQWQVNAVALGGDLVFWAYAGMLIVVVVTLARRAPAHLDGGRTEVGSR